MTGDELDRRYGIHNKGAFSGELDVSGGQSFYDDYVTGPVINLSLSASKTKGAFASVRIKGSLIGTIPKEWTPSKSGEPISTNSSKYNEINILYMSDEDIRFVNRVVSFSDIDAPSKPANLTASSITQTSCHLAWDASTDNIGVVGYKVYQDGIYIKTVTTNSTNISNGVTASTTYSFTVSAIDAADNESGQSDSVSVTTTSQVGMTYDVDYQALLDYATANSYDIPSDAQKLIDNQKIINFKNESIWAELDIFYQFKATYTPSSWATNFYRLNWKNPGVYTLGKDANEPFYTSGNGFQNTITNAYLKTGFIPGSNGVKTTTASASFVIGVTGIVNPFIGAAYFGGGRAANDTEQVLVGNVGNSAILSRFYTGTSIPSVTVDQASINGHYQISNFGSSRYLYKDGTQIYSAVYPSPVLTTVELYLLAFNSGGTATTSGTHFSISYFALGSGLTTKQNQIYQILNQIY